VANFGSNWQLLIIHSTNRRKYTTKKHKTWDGDGILSVRGGYAYLQDISGRDMGRSMFSDPLLPGSTLSIGGKEIEVDTVITREDFMSGRPFLKSTAKRTPNIQHVSHKTLSGGGGIRRTPSIENGVKRTLRIEDGVKSISSSPTQALQNVNYGLPKITVPAKNFYAPAPKSVSTQARFRNPVLTTTVMPQSKDGTPTPRHNPNAIGALVMKRPRDCPNGKQIVDVVLDPLLGQKLRPHQREGVKFLYECVMGMRSFNGQGALLADEMGLGKTLQTIALIWTLLKQNPIHGLGGVIKKALIVCPVTLMDNWKREFNKWLGNQNIGVFVADGQNIRLSDFTHGRSYSVMIIGYEKLRSVQDELKKGGGIDIVIADEGHRLKTKENKAAQAIKNLDTPMRVVLSGTPMQNDLSEFFVMVDFVNPGLLGTYSTFKKEFELPIMKSRQPGASRKDVEKGTARGEELSSLTKECILRRPATILNDFLPPKTEYVLFCKPTQAQAEVYQHVLESPVFGKVLGSPEASLQLITMLKKVCNSPTLLTTTDKSTEPTNNNVTALLESVPSSLLHMSPLIASSKMRVLDRLVRHISEKTKEKIVLVSNYTSTLDLLGQHLSSLSLSYLRLDGSTPAAKRQGLINQFNKTDASKSFAFLLSAKSGGAGINLIGASRLVLFDVDWNPATDLQAMARIHRDGQKLPVKIYRFLMAGGMDEKIYQRQITKMGLADSVVDGKKNDASFSAEELRDLFRLDLRASCQTHDLLGCDCKGRGLDPGVPPSTPDPVVAIDSDQEEDDSDDELLFPVQPALVPATKANVEAMDKQILEGKKQQRKKVSKEKMQALMEYSHVDASIFTGEKVDVFGYEVEEVAEARKTINDGVLVNMLEEKNCKVGYVFTKKG
jgi:DNA repair and recombination protein RAD54B